jgi:hypothetical protein
MNAPLLISALLSAAPPCPAVGPDRGSAQELEWLAGAWSVDDAGTRQGKPAAKAWAWRRSMP